MKKAQVTLFIIIGVVILIVFGVVIGIVLNSEKQNLDSNKESITLERQAELIQSYSEQCLFDVTTEGIYILGEQGGFIDPQQNNYYGDYEEVRFYIDGPIKVPFWYYNTDHSPSIYQLEERLSNYVAVDGKKCFNVSHLESLKGTNITKPVTNYQGNSFDFSKEETDIEVNLNSKDVSIRYYYPLTLRKDDNKKILSEFYTEVPIALKKNFEIAKEIINKGIVEEDYYLPEDCKNYQRGGYNSIYTFKDKIIIYDYEPYFNQKLSRTFVFQFAYEGVTIYGFCN